MMLARIYATSQLRQVRDFSFQYKAYISLQLSFALSSHREAMSFLNTLLELFQDQRC
jgi:hypothetical protein